VARGVRRGARVRVSFVAIADQYQQLKPEIDAAIARVIARSAFIGGAELDEFERWFAEYCGVRHAVGVGSGTAALELALGAFGVGGLVTTADDSVAAQLRLLRDHGRTSKYEHALAGYTARLDNLQAAILRVQAGCLDEWNTRRRQAATWYRAALPPQVTVPADEPGAVYHLFVVRVPRRDAFRAYLEAHGVATAI